MAKRRMFSLDIIDTDKFLEMPATSQALYFHLGMRADDDGFISSPKKVTNIVNCSIDDLKILISKGYVIPFESGIVVVRHWHQNNYVRTDRYVHTIYTDEMSKLVINNGVYDISTQCDIPNDIPNGIPNDIPNGIPNDIPNDIPAVATGKGRLGKDSIGKDSIGKDSIGKDSIGKDSIGKGSVVESQPNNNHTHPQLTKEQMIIYNDLVSKYNKQFVDIRIERARKYPHWSMNNVKKWCDDDWNKEQQSPTTLYDSLIERFCKQFVDEKIEYAKNHYANVSMMKISQWCENDWGKWREQYKINNGVYPEELEEEDMNYYGV